MELQDEQGLLFAPESDIATLTPEYRERWRVVLKDGTVANRPTPPPPGPWVPHGKSLVAPCHLVATAEGWRDPAGFLYAPGDLPAPPEPKEEERWPPTVPALPCHPDRVISLLGYERNCYWHTDDGDIHWKIPAVQAAEAHPTLLKIGKGVFLNRPRLRRINKDNRTTSSYTMVMDSGDRYELDRASLKPVTERLGLLNLTYLEPHRPGLKRYDLRDYPYEIRKARRERLRADFRNRKHLMANIVWQFFRSCQEGPRLDYGEELRDLFYTAIEHCLFRAGWLQIRGEDDKDKAWKELTEIVRQLVADYRLFTYQEIGFIDDDPGSRIIGRLRPEVVLVAEKKSLGENAFRLAEEFGISCQVVGGSPTLNESEYFARALGEVGQGPVRVIAYVDYDPPGWAIGDTFAKHLTRFGLPHVQPVEFLVRAENFTAEELELFAMPCSTNSPSLATKARQWLKRCGGINGQLLMIHANHLEPYERVRACMARLLGWGTPSSPTNSRRFSPNPSPGLGTASPTEPGACGA